MDVVIGGGYGVTAKSKDGIKKQGQNFVEGPIYLTDADLKAVDVQNGGRYVTAAAHSRTERLTGSADRRRSRCRQQPASAGILWQRKCRRTSALCNRQWFRTTSHRRQRKSRNI
jgi:hypothetical protein